MANLSNNVFSADENKFESDLLNEMIDFNDFNQYESITKYTGTYELTYIQFRDLYLLKKEKIEDLK